MIEVTFITKKNQEMYKQFIPSDVTEWFFLGRPFMIGAVSDETACGLLMMQIVGDTAEICKLTVADGFDRDAVMEALVGFVAEHPEEFGIRSVSATYEGEEHVVLSMDRAYLNHGFSLRLEHCYHFRISVRDVLASDMARRLAQIRESLISPNAKPLRDIPKRYLQAIPNAKQAVSFDVCDQDLSYAYVESEQLMGILLIRRKDAHIISLEDLYTVRINPTVVMMLVGAVMKAAAKAVKEKRLDPSDELIFQMTSDRGTEMPKKMLHILPDSEPWYHIAELLPALTEG